MPHRETQKFLVRLLYDPTLLERLKANPGLLQGLSSEERASLLAIDPRALRAEPLRRRRTLRGLIDELKISMTMALSEWRLIVRLEEGFFSSERFHKAITKDTLLVLALANFLEDECSAQRLKSPHLREVLRYESACLQSRRAPALQPTQAALTERSVVKRAHGVFGIKFSVDVIAIVQHVERFLFELSLLPQMALCEDAPRLSPLSLPAQEKRILLTPIGGEVSLSNLDVGLYALLEALSAPREVKTLAQILAPFGVPAKHVIPLLSSLQSEGLIESKQ
jgi:hypothetical protein